MIEISESQLDEGLFLASSVSDCNSLIDCFFGKMPIDSLRKDKCKVFQFRKAFESDSPMLYKRIRESADYDQIMLVFDIIEEIDSLEKKREVRMKFQDLNTFAHISIVALYPLYLFNGMTVPFLSLEEINEIERRFFALSNKRAIEEIGKLKPINREWFYWMFSVSTNFNDYKRFGNAIILMTYLFVKGIEKKSLPCMNSEEKKSFFRDIEIAVNKRG